MIRTHERNTSRASIDLNMDESLEKKDSKNSSVDMLKPLKEINDLAMMEEKNHKS